jgi:hypothetical protein
VKSKELPYQDNQQALKGLHMIVAQQAASPLGFANPTFFGYDSNITTIGIFMILARYHKS